jgi:Ceramidase
MQRLIVPILLALAALGLAGLVLLPPIPQPLWYHDFADQRSVLGIANFWNVVSNVPFVFVGGLGIWRVASERTKDQRDLEGRWMYLGFFAAVAFMGAGSAFYHLNPNNGRLMWDRLPIAVTFMALFAIVIAEYLNRRAGVLLFVPLVLVGGATVFYWHLTETWGKGDLRPYLLTQLYPAVAMPLILWGCPERYTSAGTLYSAMAWYVGAKVYEFLDKEVFSFGEVISGHTLKHIGAAVSCYLILIWMRERRILDRPPKAIEASLGL